jgi:hypothetical protein
VSSWETWGVVSTPRPPWTWAPPLGSTAPSASTVTADPWQIAPHGEKGESPALSRLRESWWEGSTSGLVNGGVLCVTNLLTFLATPTPLTPRRPSSLPFRRLWNTQFAVGRNTTILSDGGGSVAWRVAALTPNNISRPINAPLVPRVAALAATYLVGTDGAVLRDTGNGFYGVALGTARSFLPPYTLYRGDVAPLRGGLLAVTSAGALYRDTTGQGPWRVVDASTPPVVGFPFALMAFSFFGNLGVAVGSGGLVRRFDLSTQVRVELANWGVCVSARVCEEA